MKRLFAMAVLCATFACSASPPTPTSARPTDLGLFVGVWRSVTPSYEFVALTVYSTSSRQNTLAARLTLSGVQLDATGSPQADSLIAAMTVVGSGQSAGTIALRAADGRTLSAQVRSANGMPLDLAFVRD